MFSISNDLQFFSLLDDQAPWDSTSSTETLCNKARVEPRAQALNWRRPEGSGSNVIMVDVIADALSVYRFKPVTNIMNQVCDREMRRCVCSRIWWPRSGREGCQGAYEHGWFGGYVVLNVSLRSDHHWENELIGIESPFKRVEMDMLDV
jgi:hypothetical protein